MHDHGGTDAGFDASFRTVQTLTFDASSYTQGLCYRAENFEGRDGTLESADGMLRAIRETRVHFDTIFNSFFEDYWKSITQFTRVRLTIRYTGAPVLRVWRHNRDESGRSIRNAVATRQLSADQREFTEVIASDHVVGRPGILSFSLEGEGEYSIEYGAWSIDAPEHRDVGLSVVTVTVDYRRMMPSFFAGIERNLSGEADASLRRLIVVNNGPETFDPELAACYPRLAERLVVINLRNIGASGGFSRGAMEAENDGVTTHVAFMDDDAVLAPGSLEKICTVLSVAGQKMVLGGQMLDMSRPNMLLASGQFFDGDSPVLANPVLNTDLTGEHWRQGFLERHAGQWNGWWLCVHPVEVFRDIGYALPFFIKWDDVEFGVRAQQNGYRMMTFPGVSVWHEAPDMKPLTWQVYFNVRNGLIVRSLRSSASRWRLTRTLLSDFLPNLLTYRYYQAKLVTEALRDYLAGPEVLDRPVRPHLAHLRDLAKAAPSFSVVPAGTHSRWSDFKELPRSSANLVRCIVWNVLAPASKAPVKRLIGTRSVRWTMCYGADEIQVDDPALDHALVQRRDHRMARRLLVEFLRTLAELYRSHDRVKDRWMAADRRLSSREHWDKLLSANEVQP